MTRKGFFGALAIALASVVQPAAASEPVIQTLLEDMGGAPRPLADMQAHRLPTEQAVSEGDVLDAYSFEVRDIDGDGLEDILVFEYRTEGEFLSGRSGADGSLLYRYRVPRLDEVTIQGSVCACSSAIRWLYIFDANGDGKEDALTFDWMDDSTGPLTARTSQLWSLMDGATGTSVWQALFEGTHTDAEVLDVFESYPWSAAFSSGGASLVVQVNDGMTAPIPTDASSTFVALDLATGTESVAGSMPLTDDSHLLVSGDLTAAPGLEHVLGRQELDGFRASAVASDGALIWSTVTDTPYFAQASMRHLSSAGPDVVLETRYFYLGSTYYSASYMTILDGRTGSARWELEVRNGHQILSPSLSRPGSEDLLMFFFESGDYVLRRLSGETFQELSTLSMQLGAEDVAPSVEPAGDLDGDGFDDLIVSADYPWHAGVSAAANQLLWTTDTSVWSSRDLDADGADDVIGATEGDWMFMRGSDLATLGSLPRADEDMIVGEFSNLPGLEIAITNYWDATLSVWTLDGTLLWSIEP